MSLLFYLLATGLPAAWILRGSSSRPWRWLSGSPKLWKIAAIYALLFALVWSCAFGLLPEVDAALFSRRDLEAPTPPFWQYQHFERFLFDDVTVFFLTFAVLSWWNREIRGLPAWFPRALSLGTYWLLLEETDYRPFGILIAPELLQRTSVHHSYPSLNLAIYVVLLAALLAYLAVRVGSRVRQRAPTGGGEAPGTFFSGLLRWARGIRAIHPAAVLLGLASSAVLSTHFSDFLGLRFTSEEDKYWDFGHSIAYLAWLLASLDYPVRIERRRALLSPVVVFVGLAVICIIKSV